MKQSRRNCQIEAAAKKGIYTFDGIIKIAKLLSEDRQISKAISNRLQYLFVDEYQDIDKYGHLICYQVGHILIR
jgi:DNA helicase-2/ATP-dependent DNA helicase PcrA